MAGRGRERKLPPGSSGWKFTEHHVRPNVYYWSPSAYGERLEVKTRREIAMGKFKEAKAKIDDEEYIEAENLLEGAIAAWPDNHKFLSALASCICYHRKDPERSLPWFDSAIEMQDCSSYRYDRAQALACMGALDEALQDSASAVAGDRKNGIYMRSRAMIYERKGMFFEAIQDYTAAIPLLKEMGESTYECIFNRGFCHKLMGHSEDAIEDFELANTLAPFSVTVKAALGGMHLQKKRYHDAQTFFSAAKVGADESPASYNNLGLVLYLMAMDPDSLKDKVIMGLQPKKKPTAEEGEGEDEDTPSSKVADETSDDDDEPWERSVSDWSMSGIAKQNEDPKQWALDNLQGGAKEQDLNLERKMMLEQALVQFSTALELYEERHRSGEHKESDAHAHAVHLNEAANVKDGLLLLLGATPHIPGTAVVHDDEIEEGEIHYNRGLVKLSLGMLEDAEADFHAALQANPTHAHFPHYRAVVLARKGELKEAVKWDGEALNMNSRYYPALYHVGLILHVLMRNAEAIQRLDVALSIHTSSWKIMEARGRVLQELDRHKEAIESLSAALRQLDIEAEGGPAQRARLHFAIAQSAIASHQRELLRSSLKDAQLNGQDPASMFSLRGLLAHREKKLEKAIKYMSRASKLAPQEASFLFDRSQVYMEMRRFESAIKDMTAALELLTNCPSLYYHRGMAYFGMDNDELACKDFEAAAKIILDAWIADDKKSKAPLLITDARLWEGAKIKSTAAAAPDLSSSLWYHLGCTKARLGDVVSAAEAFEHAAQLLPTHPAVIHELAKSYQSAGQLEKSRQSFSRLLKLQPNNANALFRRGLVHRSLKQYDAAAADMEAARKLDPNNPVFKVDYLRMGDLSVVELCRPGCETAFSSGLKHPKNS